jgi:CRP/FNR family transcriptional regulator, anaerobic regulatory protein
MYAVVNGRPSEPSLLTAPPTGSAAACNRAGKELRLPRGQTLFYDEDDAEYFFEIVSGMVRCCRLIQDGRRQINRFAGAGELLGLSGQETYNYSAEAVTDIVVRRHRLASLDSEMTRDGALRRRVLQALRDELAATRTQMMLLGRMSATEKLSSFLLALAGRSAAPDASIDLPMTRSDIADYLGLTIETVSRKMNELHALGVIRLETASHVRITDCDRIEAIADAA